MSYPQSLAHSEADFVSSDVDALASHMRHCAQAHGRWFAFQSGFQQLRSLAAGRIVTIAAVAVLLGVGLLAAA